MKRYQLQQFMSGHFEESSVPNLCSVSADTERCRTQPTLISFIGSQLLSKTKTLQSQGYAPISPFYHILQRVRSRLEQFQATTMRRWEQFRERIRFGVAERTPAVALDQ